MGTVTGSRENGIMNDEARRSFFTILVEPAGWVFDAQETTPLLQAAARERIALPSSCRNGTCRACMCRLLSGHIAYRIEWPGLSPEEKSDGFILPCVAYPHSDLVIEVPRAVRLEGDVALQVDSTVENHR